MVLNILAKLDQKYLQRTKIDQMVKNGPNWVKVAKNGSKWDQI